MTVAAHPPNHLADLLESRKEELIQRWARQVRERLHVGASTRAELVDSLPAFLDELLVALRHDARSAEAVDASEMPAVAEAHGRQRYRIGADINAVVREYGILRDVIFDLAEEVGHSLRMPELRVVTQAITTGIAEAVSHFAEEREKVLRASEARLQSIIDHAPAAIYAKDPEGRFILVNRYFERLFRTRREALLGKTDEDCFPPHMAEAFRANDQRVLANNAPLWAEEEAPQPDGPHTYLSVKFPLPDPGGRPAAVCGISTDITERKRVERALRESEERFRLLVEGVEDYAIFMLDPEGRVVSWNPGAQRIKGYKAEEIIGESFTRFYLPGDMAVGVPQHALRAAAREGHFHMEGKRVRKDGSLFWADVVITALRDEAGHLRGFAKVTRDISARKRTEQALRETTQRHRAMVETAVDGILTIDERGLIQDINPATVRIFGHAPEALIGRNISMLMPEPYRGAHDGYMDNYLRTGVRKVIGIGREVRGLRKDGSVFPLELSVSELRLPEGRFFMGVVRDISARKRAEEAQALFVEAGTLLSQSLDVSTTLRGLASLAVSRLADSCTVDLLGEDGRLHRLEAAAREPEHQAFIRELLAWPPLLGGDSPVALVLEHGEAVAVPDITPALLDAAARNPEHRAFMQRLPLRSAALVPLLARGRKLGVISLYWHQRRGAALAADLEVARGVADRAAVAIDNARLFQEAQEAVRVREDVVAIVSHDLRSPLNAINLAATALLKREEVDERTAKTASRIFAASDRASRMIRDLLDFTQARAGGGIPIHLGPLDFHAHVRRILSEVRMAHPERHIALDTHGEGQGQWDADRLAQVVTNLVGNALQHSPPDTPIRVSTRSEASLVHLEVHNQGPPISPELLPTLFEPYRRGPESGEGRGSLGLGLFITRQIVLGHGGGVGVRSTLAEGTTFTVRLPRRPSSSGS
jgi:PAS domain S-box-containing protein